VYVDKAFNVVFDNLRTVGFAAEDAVGFLNSRNTKLVNSSIQGQRCIVSFGARNLQVSGTDIIGDGTSSAVGFKADVTAASTTVTLSANLVVGATTLSVNATSATIYGGDVLYFSDGTYVTVQADRWYLAGTTSIAIEPSTVAKSATDTATDYFNHDWTTFSECFVTACLYGVWIEDYTKNTLIEGCLFSENYRSDVYLKSNLSEKVSILNNTFSLGNTSNTSNCANINADYVDGLTVVGNQFNEVGTKVKWAVELRADTSNAIITNNTIYDCASGGSLVYKYAQSVAALARGLHLFGANRLSGVTEVTGTTNYDLITVANVP
jgi:hypothetical protein